MQYPETKKIVELWKALPKDKRLELLRQLEDLVELEDLMDLDINDIDTTGIYPLYPTETNPYGSL